MHHPSPCASLPAHTVHAATACSAHGVATDLVRILWVSSPRAAVIITCVPFFRPTLRRRSAITRHKAPSHLRSLFLDPAGFPCSCSTCSAWRSVRLAPFIAVRGAVAASTRSQHRCRHRHDARPPTSSGAAFCGSTLSSEVVQNRCPCITLEHRFLTVTPRHSHPCVCLLTASTLRCWESLQGRHAPATVQCCSIDVDPDDRRPTHVRCVRRMKIGCPSEAVRSFGLQHVRRVGARGARSGEQTERRRCVLVCAIAGAMQCMQRRARTWACFADRIRTTADSAHCHHMPSALLHGVCTGCFGTFLRTSG